MLVLFQSKSAAEVLMFAQHARPILVAAGKTFDTPGLPERGVITRAQLDTAIAGIEALVAADPGHDDASGDHDDTVEHPIAQPVGMRRRAWPLLTMLRLAREKGEDVTWEPAPSW
ncbi:hypothetical protein GCM10009125_19920 [Castellaniella daejeonensis]|jgi:hypothetical protein|uniref:DUF1840 domain-containing protein n=1 Tax=Castellaniella daejeonensis TaxID=659013 RepID=A0ABN0TV62_9BURK|nr:DUF1840 domain-containing protein [Castellaniella sp.]HET8702375.1 DUF1840 domain-containing protein [Castellaniella sp.]